MSNAFDKINPSSELDGLEVDICRGEDGKLVVSITGPGDGDLIDLGSPDIRIWLNDALIYEAGEVGDDLSGGTVPVFRAIEPLNRGRDDQS